MGLFFFCLSYYIVAGIAMVIGYHRFLSHRSYKLKKWFEYLIITAGLPAGTPVQWAGNHRFHHAHTDDASDPHSPVIRGFWYAHNGWYINSTKPVICILYSIAGPIRFLFDAWNRPRTNQQYNYLAKDISANPYYAFISKPYPYMFAVLLHLIIPFSLMYNFWGFTGIFSLWFTLILIFNFGDAIDSISHLYGEQPYKKNDHAKNNIFMSVVTLGDGWHADHHQFPGSAKLGFKKGRIDFSYQIILLLKKLGIAYDLKVTDIETVNKFLK